MEHQISPGKSGQGRNGGNSCIGCRTAKMKCQIGEAGARCARCERKSLECVFQQHRRGRKLGMRTSNVAATGRLELSVDCENANESTRPPVANDIWHDGQQGLNPANLLSRQTQDGGFSLRNVLHLGQSSNARTVTPQSRPDSRDPVAAGLLNEAIARSLFTGYMADLNPFISQLDPELHTLDHVRAKSAFLFTATLMAASKVFNPALYAGLREHAELLLSESIRHGYKSAEVVQSILIMTYWKDPEDTRVFVNVGLAIRIAIDLGWHDLAGSSRDGGPAIDEREKRNVERTWLVLFVYDRSLAMQTGKPAMIEHDVLIESIDKWQESAISCPNDVLLCALVKLRLLSLGMLGSSHRHERVRHNPMSYVKLVRTSVELWSSTWLSIAEDKRHRFLINFYGRHTLLMLCSEELHRALKSQDSAQDLHLESIWRGYNAALNVLALVVEPANAGFLYFVQDSVHVMIAYAAVILVKLLLSVRKTVRDELQPGCLLTLRSLLANVQAQAAPANSACSLQTIFVNNLLEMLQAVPSDRTQPSDTGQASAGPADLDVLGRVSTDLNRSRSQRNTRGDERLFQSQCSASAAFAAPEPLDSSLFDDETWAAVFATAGFSITDGTFLPDLTTHQPGQQ